MSNARIIRRRPGTRPMSKAAANEKSGGKAKWIISVAALLLMAMGAWAFLPSGDPAVARIQDLYAQMDGATDEQRRELFGQIREESQGLTDEGRDQLNELRRQRWEAREQQRLNDFFAMTPQEQQQALDESIDREEQRNKEREQRRAQGGGGRGGPPGGMGRGGRGVRDRTDPNARAKNYLARTTPTSRAQRSEYRRMREERRQQRGLPPGGGRGRR